MNERQHEWECNVYLHYIINCILTHFESSDVWKSLCPHTCIFVHLSNFLLQGEVGNPGYPGPQGPTGPKVRFLVLTLEYWTFYNLDSKNILFSRSFSSIMVFKYQIIIILPIHFFLCIYLLFCTLSFCLIPSSHAAYFLGLIICSIWP